MIAESLLVVNLVLGTKGQPFPVAAVGYEHDSGTATLPLPLPSTITMTIGPTIEVATTPTVMLATALVLITHSLVLITHSSASP